MTRTHWILVAFVGLAGGAGGVAIWSDSGSETLPTSAMADQVGVAEEIASENVEELVEPEGAETEAASPDTTAQDTAPQLAMDTLRIEPDGSGIISGRTAPGVVVVVSVDDMPVADVEADNSGAFFSFLDLPPSNKVRVLTLSTGPDEPVQVSAGPFYIAPSPTVSPEVVDADVAGLSPQPELPAQAVLEETVEVTIADALPVASEADDVVMPVVIEQPTVADLAENLAPEEEAATLGETPVVATASEVVAEPTVIATTNSPALPDLSVVAQAPTVDLSVPALGAVEPTPPEVEQTAAAPDVEAVSPEGGFSAEVAQPVAQSVTSQTVADVPTNVTASTALVAPTTETAPADAPQPEVVAEVALPGTPDAGNIGSTPAVLVADEEGVRVVQPALAAGADAEVLRTVALDAITYDLTGDVILAGRASGGGVVRIYLNNRLLTEASVAADGTWTSGLEGIDAGVYSLRVDQLGPDGAVTSRIETPFRREERSVIASVLAEDFAQDGVQVAVRTVQPGNTLWGISQERYGDGVLYVQVFEANRDLIRDPNLIYPGQILRIPETQE